MGRGRAKAKQTKVARQLKYSSGGTDLERLQAELAAERGSSYSPADDEDGDGEFTDFDELDDSAEDDEDDDSPR